MARRSGETNEPPEIPRSVEPKTAIMLLERQVAKGQALLADLPLNTADHTAWSNTTRDYLVKAFGSASQNVNAVLNASSDIQERIGMSDAESQEYDQSRLSNQLKMLQSCIEQLETEVELSAEVTPPSITSPSPLVPTNTRVFVVHGHKPGPKEAVARCLDTLGLEPIILHEKPNAGRTIIEKFSDYSDVHFAVVLLTADDEGKACGASEGPRSRARQNVVLELGYFLGKLGRSRVCALYESGVEIPSDYQGVLFVPLDVQDKWKFDLVRELKAAGFDVDANRILTAG